jgi:hypothetical protein
VRLRAGRRLDIAALVADGHHARVDGLVSLGVVASAIAVALGVRLADPAHRPRDHARHPQDHLGFLAHREGYAVIADAHLSLGGSIIKDSRKIGASSARSP